MGPKKGKDLEVNDLFWRTSIETAILDEEEWTVKVIIIEAAGSDQDRIYLNKFETFAAEEKRFVIKNICKTETVFMINQLGTEKKVKDENLRVFEEGNAFLKEKKEIPPDIYALIIKHLILKMKEEYLFIKRQRLEVQEGMRRESATMLNKAEVKGTVSGIAPAASAVPVPPPPTQGPPQVPELPSDKKFNTSLRERGEEWRDKVYVDDYPVDGPNLYVALTGFVEPFLPGCLVKIGIPLTAVVQIRIDPTEKEIPSSLTRATKRGQSQTELLQEQSLKFWDMLQSLRIQEESADDFKNTAFIVYSPPYWKPDDLSGDADTIYDELCYLMYDVQDLSRQHLHYLDNLRIIHVPEDEHDARYKKCYHQFIDDIPLECVTIYSVLESILATACKDSDLDEKSSKSSVSEAVTLNAANSKGIHVADDKFKKSDNFVKEVFNALCKTEANKKQYRLTYGEEYETHKDPIVIDYGDFAKCKTFHLGNINLNRIVFSSLLGLPVHNLWLRHDRPEGELEAKANFHINVLLSCFERADVETSELNRLIHILACRKLYNNRSSLKKHHIKTKTIADLKKDYLKRTLAEPLLKCPSITQSNTVVPPLQSISKSMNESESIDLEEDPEVQRIKFLFDCPDISELVSAAEIASNQPIKHMIDDFDCFEDFSGLSAFQIMCEALNQFNCIDYKYCEVTDCFLLMFFNSHDKDGIAREEWRCHLATPVCLQDFFDYILEEHYIWIQNEEKIYDENNILKAHSESKDIIDADALKSCVEDTEVDTDLLMEGSLKHQEFLAKKAEEEANETIQITERSLSSKKSITSRTFDDKSSRKPKSPSATSPKTGKKAIEPPHIESSTSIEIPAKPFIGYDLGDRRVEVFGKDATFFSKDGTTISSMYSLIIPMNLEYIILSIAMGNKNSEFWIHKAIGEFVKPEIVDICESFRICTKDQVLINIKKQTCEVPVEPPNTSMTENVDKKSSLTLQTLYETKHFHSLTITWPNGMITQTVHENHSPMISHIKQYYVSQMPNLDEEMRCISLNGEVIIFKDSGVIEILKPDGSNIKVTSYFKRIVNREIIEEQTEDVSDKSKKAKGKVKSSKGSSKSSKNIILEEEKLPDVKPAEYELVIDEFEMTEPNGVRQQYIRDIPFQIEKILIRTATDYCLGEIFSKRMDGTTTLLNKDGVLIVTFPNKTRIITYYIIEDEEIYPEWTDEEKEYLALFKSDVDLINSKYSVSQRSYSDSIESKKMEEEEIKEKEKARSDGYISINIIYTIEHANFSTVTINKFREKIYIDSPNETTVMVDKNINYRFTLDSKTTANFDGEHLNISYEACSECRSFTTCNVKIKNGGNEPEIGQNWVTVKDSYCRRVVVNYEGAITAMDDFDSADVIQTDELLEQAVLPEDGVLGDLLTGIENTDAKATDIKSESSTTSHVKCRELFSAKTIRFFILKRELSCSELVHRALLDRYQRACRWQPWCSINEYNTFGDHRSLVSILTPVHLTESEKWLMESKLADKPKFLTYKDLKDDCGKGYYHWMRPYKRFEPSPMKPENVLPPRLPRAFILRTLEQQWREAEREELKGAKELLMAILRYRTVMESDSETLLHIPIVDPRTDAERRIDDYVQSLAQKLIKNRIYHDLKTRLADDVQSRAKASITTKPAPVQPEELEVAGEFGEEFASEMRSHEATDSALNQIDQASEMSPNLQRYWKRRAEELKEEEFYKYLLREGSVPPYFLNVLGGAIWWEMNHAAGEAVTMSERRRARCACSEDNTSRTDGTTFNISGFT